MSVVNSGLLYGGPPPTPPSPPLSRHERGRRIRANALDFVETRIPVIRNAVRERTGEPRDVLDRLSRVSDLMIRFALETPDRPDGRKQLALDLRDAIGEFDSILRRRGLLWSPHESLAGALVRQLAGEAAKIASYLVETD